MTTADQAKIKSIEEYWKKYSQELVEVGKDQMMKVNFPKPTKHYRIVYETYENSIEEAYFWILNYIRYDVGFPIVDKITDIFAAADTSAFGGVAQQRVGLHQDKVSGFLAVIGKMTKELFQLVRELRILDERMGYYESSYESDTNIREPAEITLKGIFIDMAEGGSKNPASVYGMARELQFTTLPDLFFGTHPAKSEDVNKVVDALEFNDAVKRVLKRKLFSYLRWKEETFKEIKNRRTFTIKYLRQHFDIIKMYMSWVKPYLRTIRQMQNDEMKVASADLISSFEGSMVEIEILGRKMPESNKDVYACVLYHFDYRTRPSMNYQAEGYQRGPLHVGEIRIDYRSYSWTAEDIANYKKMKELEDLDLMATVDGSVKAAMEALGDDLDKYLKEAGDTGFKSREPESKEKPKPKTVFEPFGSIFAGFGELLGIGGVKAPKPETKKDAFKLSKEKKNAESEAIGGMWLSYKNFKKAHKMVTW